MGEVEFPHAALADILHDIVMRNRLADLGHAVLHAELGCMLRSVRQILVELGLIICGWGGYGEGKFLPRITSVLNAKSVEA
jgi:hypothetical protein